MLGSQLGGSTGFGDVPTTFAFIFFLFWHFWQIETVTKKTDLRLKYKCHE